MSDEPEQRFQLRKSKDAQFYFVQLGANGKVLTTSEMYTRLRDALRGAHDAGAEGEVEYVGYVGDEG